MKYRTSHPSHTTVCRAALNNVTNNRRPLVGARGRRKGADSYVVRMRRSPCSEELRIALNARENIVPSDANIRVGQPHRTRYMWFNRKKKLYLKRNILSKFLHVLVGYFFINIHTQITLYSETLKSTMQ